MARSGSAFVVDPSARRARARGARDGDASANETREGLEVLTLRRRRLTDGTRDFLLFAIKRTT